MSILPAIIALLLGVVLATQIGINKQLGEALNNFYIPAFVNMVVGVLATLVITYIATDEWPTRELVRNAPWYAWLGGILGAAYVTAAILLAPRLGAAALIGLVVAGQLVFSVLIDHLGWIGFEQRPAGIARLAGCALMLIGVFFISRY
jgi:bacterial/archaeal transporter family-2 protein